MRVRAVAILIEDDQLALIERHRRAKHFFALPGGGVDPGETVEQAVIREMEEETGLRIAVKRKVAEAWFEGNRQDYFLVERLGGQYGTGQGEEFMDRHPELAALSGTYHPTWLPLKDLLVYPVLPSEIAGMIVRYGKDRWPAEIIQIQETAPRKLDRD
jgi:8-oxo-dGTP pyrophosphatase MutT (NUDIX family)